MFDSRSDSQGQTSGGPHPAGTGEHGTTRVVYTCWPFFGGVFCGIATVILGIVLILQSYFPFAPELVWGVVLILIGAFIALRSRDGADPWR